MTLKTYLANPAYTNLDPVVDGLATVQGQLSAFGVAHTKKAFCETLAQARLGASRPDEIRANDSFTTWVELLDAGLVDSQEPALYVSDMSGSRVARVAEDGTATLWAVSTYDSITNKRTWSRA